MKVKSIEINGMHKVVVNKYVLNDIIYFVGPNGSGKSTVLQAIQLALLGYIPGYAKTNESIMKHAGSKIMAVTAVLEADDGSKVEVSRSWVKTGTSVSSKVEVNPEVDIESMLGSLELPIFNFNEFKGMTANKLKDWFITFLPNTSSDINWEEKLTEAVGSRAIMDNEYLEEVMGNIKSSPLSGVELVRGLNTFLKESQSFYQGQAKRLQSTVDSLIFYDDADEVDADEVESEIQDLSKLRDELRDYTAKLASYSRVAAELESIKLSADKLEDDPEYISLNKKSIDLQDKKAKDMEAVYRVQGDISTLNAEMRNAGNTSSDVCPYTHQRCAEISAMVQDVAARKAEITEKLNTAKTKLAEAERKAVTTSNELDQVTSAIKMLSAKYSRALALRGAMPSEELVKPTDKTVEEIDTEIAASRDKLTKAAANARYTELMNSITKDKYAIENRLELIKIWTKLTDANGLQTEMMNKPFEDLADKMSEYLSKMFGKPTVAKFNLSSKANSFSFGVLREDNYIEFDCMSSGEKCLYTLALMMCIIDASDSQLKILLIDDILDHLDEENADKLFATLKEIKGIQIVLAGVKDCKDSSICHPIEFMKGI